MRPSLLPAVTAALALASCYSTGDGQAPPFDRLYFPTGLAIDTVQVSDGAPRYLYVASSDFDLQYRSSALASLDLERIARVVPQSCALNDDCDAGERCDTTPSRQNGNVPSYFCVSERDGKPCGAFAEHSNADRLLYPGRCASVDPQSPEDGSEPLIVDSVGIGAFATDVILRANPDPEARYPARLFLPVRGDATLHWIDLGAGSSAGKGGTLHCGQSETDDHSCDAQHRAGNIAADDTNRVTQPSEPFGVDATPDGGYIAVTNQTTGSVSLFSNDWSANGGPKLESVLTGLPSAPIGIAALPDPVLTSESALSPGFLVSYRNAAQIDLLRIRSDLADTPSAVGVYPRFVLTRAGSAPVSANSVGFDSRGIVIDDAERELDYAACDDAIGCASASASGLAACREKRGFSECAARAHQPSVYVANRTPSSLLVGGLTPDDTFIAGSSELPSFVDSVALTSGPSRVVLGNVRVPSASSDAITGRGRPYVLERRVFVVCFDSRRIYVYDPKRRVIETIIGTGRGPFALAIDDQRGLGYVAHFTDSYLGVISLDQRFPRTYASIVANIGTPSPPRASK